MISGHAQNTRYVRATMISSVKYASYQGTHVALSSRLLVQMRDYRGHRRGEHEREDQRRWRRQLPALTKAAGANCTHRFQLDRHLEEQCLRFKTYLETSTTLVWPILRVQNLLNSQGPKFILELVNTNARLNLANNDEKLLEVHRRLVACSL